MTIAAHLLKKKGPMVYIHIAAAAVLSNLKRIENTHQPTMVTGHGDITKVIYAIHPQTYHQSFLLSVFLFFLFSISCFFLLPLKKLRTLGISSLYVVGCLCSGTLLVEHFTGHILYPADIVSAAHHLTFFIAMAGPTMELIFLGSPSLEMIFSASLYYFIARFLVVEAEEFLKLSFNLPIKFFACKKLAPTILLPLVLMERYFSSACLTTASVKFSLSKVLATNISKFLSFLIPVLQLPYVDKLEMMYSTSSIGLI